MLWLISNGDLNVKTTAIVVDRQELISEAVSEMITHVLQAGGDPDTVTVNPVGLPHCSVGDLQKVLRK